MRDLKRNHPKVIERFYVGAKEVFKQKMEYIHYNPDAAGICNLPEEYKYSSAKFYEQVQMNLIL